MSGGPDTPYYGFSPMGTIEQILLYAGIACEMALIGILWRSDALRRLPFFGGYLAWSVLSDLVAAILAHGSSTRYFHFYRMEFVADSLIQSLVLVELARGVLRTLPVLVARGAVLLLILITTGAGTVLWHLAAGWSEGSAWSAEWSLILRVQLAASLLRILFLLLLGGLIEFLGRNFIPIGWGDRELQVATGLGIYALASLATSLRLYYPMSGAVLRVLDLVVALTFIGVVIYWIVSFLRPERSWLPERSGAAGERAVAGGVDRPESA